MTERAEQVPRPVPHEGTNKEVVIANPQVAPEIDEVILVPWKVSLSRAATVP